MNKNKHIERKKKRRKNKERYAKKIIRESNEIASNSIYPLGPKNTNALKKLPKNSVKNNTSIIEVRPQEKKSGKMEWPKTGSLQRTNVEAIIRDLDKNAKYLGLFNLINHW